MSNSRFYFRSYCRLLAIVIFVIPAFSASWAESFHGNAYSQSELQSAEVGDEAKIREIRDQEMTQLRITLGRHVPENRRVDLYVRLAELYMEAYHAAFLLEGRVHEKRIAEGIAGGIKDGNQEQNIDHHYSHPYLIAGIAACKDVLKFKLKNAKNDEIYFFLGTAYQALGDQKQSTYYFELLVKLYPKSQYAGEAAREVANDAFNKLQFKKAQALYAFALTTSTEESKPLLLHKLAWSYYRTKDYLRAIQAMKDAVASASESKEKFLSLRDEALRDLAIFMTEAGRVDEALEYFRTVADPTFYPKALERLGKQYERAAEAPKAIQVYESLLKTNPGTSAAFRAQAKLVDIEIRKGNFKEAIIRLRGVEVPDSATVAPSGSGGDSGDADTAAEVERLKALIRKTATGHHDRYRKKHDRSDLEIADAFYDVYLKLFPKENSQEINMYLAEVKRELGRSGDASNIYRSVVHSNNKYSKTASSLWIGSLLDEMKKAGAASPKGSASLTEPSVLEKEFLQAVNETQSALGESQQKSKEFMQILLKAAEVEAGYSNTRGNAIRRIKQLIAIDPSSHQAVVAARLWIQLLIEDKQGGAASTEELASVLKEINGNSVLLEADTNGGSGKLHALINDQEVRLKLGSIGKSEKDKDYAGAASQYEALGNQAKDRDFAEKTYVSAVNNSLKAEDAVAVQRIISGWLNRFPKSPKAFDTLKTAATTFLIQGAPRRAASLFEQGGRESADPNELETAAKLYEGAGDLTRAQIVLADYLRFFPKSPNHWAVAQSLGELQENLHFDSEASKAYLYCMSGPAEFKAACGVKLADLYVQSRDIEKAKNNYMIVAGKLPGARNSPYVAYARFKLAKLLEDSVALEPFPSDKSKFESSLNKRMEFLKSLETAYKSAMDAGGPWGVAALSRLAYWVKRFADDLDAYVNSQAKPDSKTNQLMEKLVTQLRTQAKSTWLQAYTVAEASELLSPAIVEISEFLADAKADSGALKFRRAQGLRGMLRFAGIPVASDSDALRKVRERLLDNVKDSTLWINYGNLLLGEGKRYLAEIAYLRALALDRKNPAAMNNLAVIALMGRRAERDAQGNADKNSWSEESWSVAMESNRVFKEILKEDEFCMQAKWNRAMLLNYYRLFAKAKPLWDQVIVKESEKARRGAYVGLGIAFQGTGFLKEAEESFHKANSEADAGQELSDDGFGFLYHEAARATEAERCLRKLRDIDQRKVGGFEQLAVEKLREACEIWKKSK